MKKCLIIQTAFIGDVILSTSLIEKLKKTFPDLEIHFLLKKGNESLLKDHPQIDQLYVWDKSKNKYKNMFSLIVDIRKHNFDLVVNVHRFGSSGLFSFLSKGVYKSGFSSNPFAFCYAKTVDYSNASNEHEIKRNQALIEEITDSEPALPKLYPSKLDFIKVKKYIGDSFVCFAPASVWATKQLPIEKWIELANKLKSKKIYLLGGKTDFDFVNTVIEKSNHSNIENLCGKLSLLESAAIMSSSDMNYVNDSGPMHLSSAMNTPTTAFYCSTIPSFGFGPLSDDSKIIEIDSKIACRPCGLHGHKKCPENNFRCGNEIDIDQIRL